MASDLQSNNSWPWQELASQVSGDLFIFALILNCIFRHCFVHIQWDLMMQKHVVSRPVLSAVLEQTSLTAVVPQVSLMIRLWRCCGGDMTMTMTVNRLAGNPLKVTCDGIFW